MKLYFFPLTATPVCHCSFCSTRHLFAEDYIQIEYEGDDCVFNYVQRLNMLHFIYKKHLLNGSLNCHVGFDSGLICGHVCMAGTARSEFNITKRTSTSSLPILKQQFSPTVSSCGLWPCHWARGSREDSWCQKWVSLSHKLAGKHNGSWLN